MGFEKIFVSKYDAKTIADRKYPIDIVAVSVIEEAFRGLFS